MNTPPTASPNPADGAATTSYHSPDLPPAIGKFVVVERLGQGTFGTVYKARDPELSRLVAVKVPRAGTFHSATEEERFLREARAAAQLDHPNIVRVLEVARADGLPYIVSQYVEGVTLADRLTAGRPDFRTAAEWVAQVADALDHAHHKGVIHRDVKPGNILLSFSREAPASAAEALAGASRLNDVVPKVADFGLARREEGEVTLTQEGQILGTPAYMSPEQAAGQGGDVDGRSDVYGLGVVLYELLTGELPFRGNTRMLLHQVLHDDPKPPRKLNDAVPRDLETVCLKAMAKETARRYATAGEFRDDLRRWLSGVPITARPAGRVERAWRWCRRKPAVAALLASLLLAQVVIVAGSVGFALYYRQTAERLDDARQAAQEREGNLAHDRAVLLSEANNAECMLWLARALELQKGEARPELDRYHRVSLTVWAQHCTLRDFLTLERRKPPRK